MGGNKKNMKNNNNSTKKSSNNQNDSNFASNKIMDATDGRGLRGTSKVYLILGFIIVIMAIIVYVSFHDPEALKPSESISRIKADFKSQPDQLWTLFEAGVNDVVTFNTPSIFIFLYKEEAEATLNHLLKRLAQLAACNITSCSRTPLELTSGTLNSPEILEDYGVILERYQSDLEQKGVLIVKQLETVSGASAQAFHSICDEVTPFVSKLLVMFTVKVQEEPLSRKESFKHVVELLRGHWKDEMEPEVFGALIARITNMIIQVNP